MSKPLTIYVKQCYSLSLPDTIRIRTPSSCTSSESLATVVIDLNNNELSRFNDNDNIDQQLKPLKPSKLCACPISIEILMFLSLKQIPFDVKLCNPCKILPEELRLRMIHRLPVLLDRNNMDHAVELDIIDYLQTYYPDEKYDFPLKINDRKNPFHNAEMDWQLLTIIHNVNRRFYHYVQQYYQYHSPQTKLSIISNDDSTSIHQQLMLALGQLNTALTWFATKYAVTDDHPTTIDCHLMTRLHQIRIVLEQLSNETIPEGYSLLWQYLNHAYEWNVFRRWCPSDQEILLHWMLKYSRLLQPWPKLMQLMRSRPTFTMSGPKLKTMVTEL